MLICLQHQRTDGNVDTYHLKAGRRYHIGRGSGCEVRILDFKLSRKHCVVDCVDGRWQITDLASTNGCRLDGEQIVGATPLAIDATIELGQSRLRTLAAEAATGDDQPTTLDIDTGKLKKSAAPTPRVKTRDDSAESHPAPLEPQSAIEPMPLDDTNAGSPASARLQIENVPAHYPGWEPEPGTDIHNKTDALMPKTPIPAAPVLPPLVSGTGTITRPPRRDAAARGESGQRGATRIVPVVIHAGGDDSAAQPALEPLAAPAPAILALDATAPTVPTPVPFLIDTVPTSPALRQPIPTPVPAPLPLGGDDRTFFITVLGRRIGPLTRAVARDLKVRELKGTLTLNELDAYPR